MHAVDERGRVHRGAAAFLRAASVFGPLFWAPVLCEIPVARQALEAGYRWFAARRSTACKVG